MSGVEAMTRHAFIKGGIDPDELPMLVYHALRGHGPSGRAMERAIKGGIFLTLPTEEDACPLAHPNDRLRREGILYAPIDVGGFVWEDRAIRGTLPETIAMSLPGRPLREMVDADFIPETTIMAKPLQPRQIVRFERIVADMPRPSLRRRIAWLPTKWRLFVAEGMMDGPKPRWMIGIMAGLATTTGMLAALKLTGDDWRGGWDWAGVAMLAAASLNSAWFVVNGMRRRQFSLFHAWTAPARHNSELRL